MNIDKAVLQLENRDLHWVILYNSSLETLKLVVFEGSASQMNLI